MVSLIWTSWRIDPPIALNVIWLAGLANSGIESVTVLIKTPATNGDGLKSNSIFNVTTLPTLTKDTAKSLPLHLSSIHEIVVSSSI